MKSEYKHIANWGNYPRAKSQLFSPASDSEVHTWVKNAPSFIPRGNGRCYGDAALADNILETLTLNQIINFDREKGVIHCQSGVLLSEILSLVVPEGFFLFVSPGTRFITVGGAIAADIHGKNHHKEGSFSNYLLSFKLILAEGSEVICSRNENTDLFWATCGGMGLTGIITEATFRLRPVQSAYISQVSYKTKSLAETLEKIDSSMSSTYSVAWIDCMAKGEKLGRGLLLNGEHADDEDLDDKRRSDRFHLRGNKSISVPFNMPGIFLNNLSVKLFNLLYYYRQRPDVKHSLIHYEPYFYPLDSILNWNRIYGKNGFTQYQCVLPQVGGKAGIRSLLSVIRDSGFGSFLTVLKLLGPGRPESPLAFPMEGYTLALDFKIQKGLFSMLDKLDRIVLEHGGRLYLAKDARMDTEMFRATYPDAKLFTERYLSDNQKLYSRMAQRLKL